MREGEIEEARLRVVKGGNFIVIDRLFLLAYVSTDKGSALGVWAERRLFPRWERFRGEINEYGNTEGQEIRQALFRPGSAAVRGKILIGEHHSITLLPRDERALNFKVTSLTGQIRIDPYQRSYSDPGSILGTVRADVRLRRSSLIQGMPDG